MIHDCVKSAAVLAVIVPCVFLPAGASAATLTLKDKSATTSLLKLGTYRVGSDAVLKEKVIVKNELGVRIRFEKITVSCGCVAIEGQLDTLAPGESGEFTIAASPAAEGILENGRTSMKLVSVVFRKIIKEKESELESRRIRVQWRVRHPLIVQPSKLIFDHAIAGVKINEELVVLANPLVTHASEKNSSKSSSDRIEVTGAGSNYGFLKTRTDGNRLTVYGAIPDSFTPARSPALIITSKRGVKKMPRLRVPLQIKMPPKKYVVIPSQIIKFNRPESNPFPIELKVIGKNDDPIDVKTVVMLDEQKQKIRICKFSQKPYKHHENAILLATNVPILGSKVAWLKLQLDDSEESSIMVRVIYAFQTGA